MIAYAVGLITNYAQVGILFSAKAIKTKFQEAESAGWIKATIQHSSACQSR